MHSVIYSVKILLLTKSDYIGNEPAARVGRPRKITYNNIFELAIL